MLHGDGGCGDRCPDLFVVLDDGLGYVYDDGDAVSSLAAPVPAPQADAAVDAAELCPEECTYHEVDPSSASPDDGDIHDAKIVVDAM